MTAQIHEQLILDGQDTSMAFCPPLPHGHPRIYEPRPHEIIRDEYDFVLGSTACWRGYLGTWEIKDRRFYLRELRGRFQLRGDPIFADWFSGVLRVPLGEELEYVHMGFETVYEQEIHITIEHGVVVRSRVIDNHGHQDGINPTGW